MADSLYTTSLNVLIKNMVDGNFVRAKYVRRGIDNEKAAKNALKLDGDLLKRYNAFKKVVEKTDKKEAKIEFGGDTFTRDSAEKIVNTVEGKGDAQDRLTYRQLSEKSNALMGKLFSDMKGIYEMGHKDLSVLTAQMALLLKEMDQKDPRRPKLRALYVVAEELDKITEPANLKFVGKGKADLDTLINLSESILTSDYDITASAEIAVGLIKGIDGEVTFEMENKFINQLKGRMAARMGKLLKGIVEGNTTAFDKQFAGVNILGLQGSANIQDRIAKQVRDTLDPEAKNPKDSVLKPKPGSGSINKATKRKKKGKSSRITPVVLRAKRSEKKNAQKSKIALSSLLPILNAALTGRVASNMGSPALENRTGRFASSVRAVDAVTTAKGHVSVGYTYQKAPYQVYESTSGTRFSNAERDPRRIIDLSIREIAAQFGLGRLYTRRV